MRFLVCLWILCIAYVCGYSQNNGTTDKIEVSVTEDSKYLRLPIGADGENPAFILNHDTVAATIEAGRAVIERETENESEIIYLKGTREGDEAAIYYVNYEEQTIKEIPFWLSIFPPLIAILFALIFREVIISLFAGIWFGAWVAFGMSPSVILRSLLSVIDKYFIQSLMDTGHLSVILFSLMIGGMVALISRNGGMAGVVNILSGYARSSRSAQGITYFMGIAIFFDDYANTLIVGNTMRPVTDRFKVSREKLAYVVDSTAAPVAAVAFISTWIGAELGYIDAAINNLNIDESAYSLFLHSLKYSFYPFFALLFMFLIIWWRRDFGSMHRAETRARTEGKLYETAGQADDLEVDASLKSLDPASGAKPHWYNAVVPILVVVLGTIAGLFYTGFDSAIWGNDSLSLASRLSAIIGNADSYVALLWASLGGLAIALIMTIGGRTMSVAKSIESLMDGFKTMLPAIVILVMAWALASLTQELYTAEYLISLLSGNISPYAMPAFTFILAGLISFSTGSSWSTMAILYPLILPGTWLLSMESGLEAEESMIIMYNVIASVLGGSVLGDHCSPISDTTVLSSLASSCNHIDHVRTQLPYALIVGAICVFTGGLLFWAGVPWYLNYIIGITLIVLVVRFFGKPVPDFRE